MHTHDTYIHSHTYTHKHTHIHTQTHTDTHTYTHAHTQIHTHTHTHTHTHGNHGVALPFLPYLPWFPFAFRSDVRLLHRCVPHGGRVRGDQGPARAPDAERTGYRPPRGTRSAQRVHARRPPRNDEHQAAIVQVSEQRTHTYTHARTHAHVSNFSHASFFTPRPRTSSFP